MGLGEKPFRQNQGVDRTSKTPPVRGGKGGAVGLAKSGLAKAQTE